MANAEKDEIISEERKFRRIKRGSTVEKLDEFRLEKSNKRGGRKENIPFDESTIEVLLDSSDAMLLVVNPENNEIMACNKKVEEKLRKKYTDINYISEIFPENVVQVINSNTRIIKDQKIKINSKDTTIADLHLSTIYWSGKEMLLVKIVEKSSGIQEDDEMASVDQVKRICAGTAHDLNNIMTIITGNVNLAERYSNKQNMCDFPEVHKAIDRAKQLVKQLMDLNTDKTVELKEGDLNQFIKSIISIYYYWETKDNIEIEFYDNPEACVCNFDENAMVQIIQNILQNSKEAMHQGGTIRIAVNNLNAEKICITIEDNGPGISEENIKRIFDPEFSTKLKGINYGLGLSVVEKFIKQHNGGLYVKSKTGEDSFTRFFIILPKK
jgi:two-component system, sporulation sensor kinase E